MAESWKAGFQFAERFTVLEKIGDGAQAEVYKCTDSKRKNAVVALKRYRNVQDLEEEDWDYIQNEARLLQQMDHKNIMKCYDVFRRPQEWVIVLEYIHGVSLEALISSRFGEGFKFDKLINPKTIYQETAPFVKSPNLRYQYQSAFRRLVKGLVEAHTIQKTPICKTLPPELSRAQSYESLCEQVILQLCDALVYLSGQSVAHRDLKPANLMLTPDLVLKLVDFGLSKRGNKLNTFVGTRGFMAPELLRGDAATRVYSSKVDIWAAGAMFYNMLFGISPCISSYFVPFEVLQSENGLYIPPDVFWLVFDAPAYENLEKYLDIFEWCFVVDESQRIDATGLKRLVQLCLEPRRNGEGERMQIRTIFLGDYGVGKSTLMYKMAKATLHEQIRKITRFVTVDNRNFDVAFLDTIGTEARGKSMLPNMLRNIRLCFLVCSDKDPDSFANLSGWYRDLLAQVSEPIYTVVLENSFATACAPEQTLTQTQKFTQAQLQPVIGDELKAFPFYKVDLNANLDDILRAALRSIIEQEKQFAPKQPSQAQPIEIKAAPALPPKKCC